MGESFNLIKSYVCWNSLRLLPLSQPAFMQQMDHIDTDISGILPLNFDKDKYSSRKTSSLDICAFNFGKENILHLDY